MGSDSGVAGGSERNSKTREDGSELVVRPRVNAPQTEKNGPSSVGLGAVGNVAAQTAEVVLATLANTGAATALLAPLHQWSSSRKRVAEAVEAAAAAKKQRQQQQRAFFEQQQQQKQRGGRDDPTPWAALLRGTFPLPSPVENAYGALTSVATLPGQLAESGERAAEKLSDAAEAVASVGETVAATPDRARRAIAQARETAKAAREVAAAAPARVEELVAATQELPGRVKRALEEGAETITALGEAGRKASEVVETLPSRLPDLVETVANDAALLASDVAEVTATGLDAAGTAIWDVAKEAGGWAAEQVLRQALTPVHKYRASARRVQAALDEERIALLGSRPQQSWPPSSVGGGDDGPERGTASSAIVAFAETAAAPKCLSDEARAASGSSDNTPGSGPGGLRGWFSSWRRRRRSVVALTVADGDGGGAGDIDGDGGREGGEERGGERSASRAAATVLESVTPPTTAFNTAGLGRETRAGTIAAAAAATATAAAAAAVEPRVGQGRGCNWAKGREEEPSWVSAGSVATPAPAGLGEAAGSVDERRVTSGHRPAARAETAGDRAAAEMACRSSPSSLAAATAVESEERARVQPRAMEGARVTAQPLGPVAVGGVAQEKGDANPNEIVAAPSSGSFEEPSLGENAAVAAVTDEEVSRPSRAGPEGNGRGGRKGGEEADTSEGDASFGPAGPPSPAAVAAPSPGAGRTALPLDGAAGRDGTTSRSDRSLSTGGRTENTAAAAAAVRPEGAAAEVPDPATLGVAIRTTIEGDEATGAASTLSPPEAGRDSATSAGVITGDGDRESPSSARGVRNPEAEVLEERIDTARTQEETELKETGRAVCWERQWYPVAILSELEQKRQRSRGGDGLSVLCEILGRTHELRPVPNGPPPARTAPSPEDPSWSCRAVVDTGCRDDGGPSSSEGSAVAAEVPVRESSGLLWAWLDSSPEGIAAAALADPVPLPEFSTAGAGGPRRWPRLLRHQSPNKIEDGGGGGGGGGRRRVVVLERDVPCGYSDAVGGLLAASHGKAVEAAAAGRKRRAVEGEDLMVGTSSASDAGSGSGVDRGGLLFASPTVLEWRFSSPAALPATDETPAGSTTPAPEEDKARTETGTDESPRRWLRRRLPGRGDGGGGGGGGSGGGGGGSADAEQGAEEGGARGGRGPGERGPEGRGVCYVAVVLPVGPGRTKVFARLEVDEPPRPLDGLLRGWHRRIRQRLLTRAVDDAASGAAESEAGGAARPQGSSAGSDGGTGSRRSGSGCHRLSSVVGEWLDGATKDGAF